MKYGETESMRRNVEQKFENYVTFNINVYWNVIWQMKINNGLFFPE